MLGANHSHSLLWCQTQTKPKASPCLLSSHHPGDTLSPSLCACTGNGMAPLGNESLSVVDSILLHTTPATLWFALPLDKFFPLPLRVALFSFPWKEPVHPMMDCT